LFLFNLHFPVPLAASSAFGSYQHSEFPHLLGCLPGTIPALFLSLSWYSWNSKGTSFVATITLSSVLGSFDAMG
jgi:hypothetical protein